MILQPKLHALTASCVIARQVTAALGMKPGCIDANMNIPAQQGRWMMSGLP